MLRQHPAVENVAVVGVKQERGDEQIVAAVVPNSTVDEAEVRAWAKERLSAYKVPRRVVTVDELPTSMIGKVLRGQVRDQIKPLL